MEKRKGRFVSDHNQSRPWKGGKMNEHEHEHEPCICNDCLEKQSPFEQSLYKMIVEIKERVALIFDALEPQLHDAYCRNVVAEIEDGNDQDDDDE
jgi:hypothetical protein